MVFITNFFFVHVVQLKGAEALRKPRRELAVIHVSLAATYTDLMQHSKAVEHYKQELALRQGSPTEVEVFSTSVTDFTNGLSVISARGYSLTFMEGEDVV